MCLPVSWFSCTTKWVRHGWPQNQERNTQCLPTTNPDTKFGYLAYPNTTENDSTWQNFQLCREVRTNLRIRIYHRHSTLRKRITTSHVFASKFETQKKHLLQKHFLFSALQHLFCNDPRPIPSWDTLACVTNLPTLDTELFLDRANGTEFSTPRTKLTNAGPKSNHICGIVSLHPGPTIPAMKP